MTEKIEAFTPSLVRQRKSDGSIRTRELMVPTEEGMGHHRQMLRVFHSLEIPMPHATGSMPGVRLIDNVLPHRNNESFYMLDIKDAFPSVDIDELLRVVQTPVIPERLKFDVEAFILDWGTTPQTQGLPLGAPCSPFLFNLYCLPMDRALSAYCDSSGITYTRYLDDLTFSSPLTLGKKRRSNIRRIIEDNPGFSINHAKSKLHSLTNGPVTITGVSLYPDRRLQPSPQLITNARAAFRDFKDIPSEELIFDDDIGRIHGWHGVIKQLSESDMTPNHVITRLNHDYYKKALGRLGKNATT